MNKIEVAVLHEAHEHPAGMLMFLARTTQRGHSIKNMDDLMEVYNHAMDHHKTAKNIAAMPHGTIKRFTPVTVAIIGASRRFLAQVRTHHEGLNFVSASLQYSDYSDEAGYVVPYELIDNDKAREVYLHSCQASMDTYKEIVDLGCSNDTAGYAAPQGLRNILIMQGNHDAWLNFIRVRGCNRNTVETQYVTMLIWQALLGSAEGDEMFAYAGPDCVFGVCREGKMSCKKSLRPLKELSDTTSESLPQAIINYKWPNLNMR